MNNKKYFVGLDIGTNSVGWATSDENYQLLHLKHKSAWGVNLFDAAETAEKRRVYRTTRRRLQRRRQRVLLLQDLFKDEMHKIDQYFFLRLNNSAYFSEDKNELLNSSRFNLFSDKDFTDKEFFKKYKTIYHLQKDLIENKDTKFDLRYIYLAVHHLVKYRGHFVLADQRINIDEFEYEQINLIFEELNDYLQMAELPVIFSSNHIESFNEVVRKSSGVINTSSRLETLFECSDKSIKAAFRLISGGSVKTKNLFSHLILSETVEKETIDLSSPTYDTEKYPLLAKELGDDIVFLDSLKRLYDHIVIVRLMKGKKLVCETMVERYEKHSEDLKKLKLLIKSTRDKELYFSIFRDTKSKNANYPSYVGSNKSNTKKTSVTKKGYQDFLDYIKKVIIDRKLETNLAKEILSDIEAKVFMPRLDTKDNATIPYQFNEYQLDLILQNAAKFYPFLNDIEEGINVIDKIKSLISFRIPYYVGPLDNRSKFSWVVRKSDEQVKPWNFGSIIDIEKSAQAFIMKMTNKCVYLKGEDVLPKESLLFEEFVVLNTLNCLKVNGKLIDYDTKQLIFNFVKQKKTVTTNMIMKLLMANNIVVEALSGIDETAKLSLSTYHKFLPIFGESIDKYKELIEKIVFYSTIFPEGIVFKNKLYSDFKNILTKEQLSTISKMKFSGWSSLSRAFLTGYSKLQEDNVLTNLKTGEIISIIDIMRDEQLTLQQVLYDKRFNLQELLYKYNLTYSENMTINDYIDEMYISPSVKRPVKKAIHIIDEIISITNSKPNKIFIEVTREEGKPERKISRQQKLINLYKPILKDNEYLKALYQEIVSRKDADFKPKKLLLYFIQQGKCMYTGQSISINELMTDKYDIDHIIPQSKIDDDSISNLCLVTNKSNKDKADVYPLNYEIIQRMKPFWQSLLKANFIDDNKYNRLIRVEPLSDQDLAIFINRQLVETSQANKAIADILKKYYPESEVIYSKARNVTLFRGKFSIYKYREINKAHHAHDAYLNIVVGNYFHSKYGYKYYAEQGKTNFNPNVFFEEKNLSFWNLNRDINTVKKMLDRKDILFTRSYNFGSGEFYEQNLSKAGSNLTPASLTSPLADTSKYGGYSGKTTSSFALIEVKKGNKLERRLYPLSSIDELMCDKQGVQLRDFISKDLGLEVRVLIDRLPINSLIIRKGTTRYLSGKDTVSTLIAHKHDEPYFSNDFCRYHRLLSKVDFNNIEDFEKNVIIVLPTNHDTEASSVSLEKNIIHFDEIVQQYSKKIYKGIYEDISQTLIDHRDVFLNLPILKQVAILIDLVKLLQTGPILKMDLASIGIGSSINRGRLATNIQQDDCLITQSITGLHEKKTKIWNVN